MMDWNGHMTASGWILMILWTLIIVALIAAVVYWLTSTRERIPTRGTSSGEPSAAEILDRRLASGELTLEQHKKLREAIGEGGTRPGTADPPPARPASAAG